VTAQIHYEFYRHKRLETLKKVPLDSVGSAPSSPNYQDPSPAKSASPSQSPTTKASPKHTGSYDRNHVTRDGEVSESHI